MQFIQSKFSLISESTILQYTVILSDLQVQSEFSPPLFNSFFCFPNFRSDSISLLPMNLLQNWSKMQVCVYIP